MTIITRPLENEEFHEVIEYISNFFHVRNEKAVIVYYGWDCNTEDLYQDMEIDIDDLKKFIQKSHNEGVFKLGKADLYVSESKENFEFQLCHESDAHFSSKNEKLIEKVKKDWEKYKPYDSTDKS